MEVDANAFVCFNCYEEGHAAAQCKNAKQPRREIIQIADNGDRRSSKPREQRIAATGVDTPAKAEKASEKKEGKKKEFEQGSSRDGDRDSAEVSALKALVSQNATEMSDLKLQFARLANILTNKDPRDESDF